MYNHKHTPTKMPNCSFDSDLLFILTKGLSSFYAQRILFVFFILLFLKSQSYEFILNYRNFTILSFKQILDLHCRRCLFIALVSNTHDYIPNRWNCPSNKYFAIVEFEKKKKKYPKANHWFIKLIPSVCAMYSLK